LIATDFYKNLFGMRINQISTSNSFWREEEKVTVEENALLTSPLSEEEIKNVIFRSYADGALGPHGFPFLFYQRF
jgi:hypothetical protein